MKKLFPMFVGLGCLLLASTSHALTGNYWIKARHSGKAVAVQGASLTNGANVFQWTYGGTATNDEWQLIELGGGYHRIVNRHSAKDMVVASASTANGGNVVQYTYGGSLANDEWLLTNLGTGYYRITNRHSGLALDVAASSTADGANVQQWASSGGTNQQFELVAIGGSCTPTLITPYLQVNGGAWQQTASVTVGSGSTVKFGPQPSTAAGWTWSGCGTSGTSREQTITPTASCNATATYTNSCGAQDPQVFSVTVSGTTPPPPPPGTRRYVAYASTWNTSIYDLKTANIPSYIKSINLAFARPDTTYTRGSNAFDQAIAGFEFVEGATTNTGQHKFTAQQAQDLKNNITALRNRGTQVWVSVGGWSYSQGDQWSRFNARTVVDLALDLGASGVDIDWESSSSTCTKGTAANFRCTKDSEIIGIITNLRNEINARASGLQISIAGWSTGAYYVVGSPFEEGKVQWGSPFGGTLYRLVADHGSKINFINLMSYDAGDYYDPREGYESYKAIYSGPINMGMEIAPEGAGGAILEVNAPAGTVYDAEMLTGQNNEATRYYNVQTMVNYIKNRGRSNDGFMLWQLWKQRVHQPAPAGAATENSAGQYVCRNLPLTGDCNATIPSLPKL